MNNFIFENATKVYFGKGCVKEYLACLSGRYGQTVMLCYGGGSVKKNGIYDEVTACLRKAGQSIVEFSGIGANPTYAKVLEGARLAKENQVAFAIMKQDSPSCGSKFIYDGTFTDTKKEGQGLAVEYLRNAGFTVFGEEDLDEAEKLLAELEG